MNHEEDCVTYGFSTLADIGIMWVVYAVRLIASSIGGPESE